jgi:hypothetical protein
LMRPHLPTHDILKVRRVVHLRNFGKLVRTARNALERARRAFEGDLTTEADAYDSDDAAPIIDLAPREPLASMDAALRCALCQDEVTQPCWYCVQCESQYFCSIYRRVSPSLSPAQKALSFATSAMPRRRRR